MVVAEFRLRYPICAHTSCTPKFSLTPIVCRGFPSIQTTTSVVKFKKLYSYMTCGPQIKNLHRMVYTVIMIIIHDLTIVYKFFRLIIVSSFNQHTYVIGKCSCNWKISQTNQKISPVCVCVCLCVCVCVVCCVCVCVFVCVCVCVCVLCVLCVCVRVCVCVCVCVLCVCVCVCVCRVTVARVRCTNCWAWLTTKQWVELAPSMHSLVLELQFSQRHLTSKYT